MIELCMTDIQKQLDLPAEAWLPCRAIELPDAERIVLDGDWQTAQRFLAQRSTLEILRIYISLLPQVRSRYDALGIPEDIFWDGVRDIEIWTKEHKKRFGSIGLDAWPWVAKTLRMEVFRLGRLQFEPVISEAGLCSATACFPRETALLNVHIPAGERLRENEVRESLRRARPFFRQTLNFEAQAMHCRTWLLSPVLQELLPEESGILRFQSMFEIYATAESHQAEERVFGRVENKPQDYPQDTLLQRRMREYLLSGKTIGVGIGVAKENL